MIAYHGRPPHGFTLVEMIVVIVLLSIASIAVVTMVANVGSRQDDNRDLQVGAQLLQECGESIVANHRRDDSFYTDVMVVGTSANCYSLLTTVPYAGFDLPSVTTTDHTGATACPPTPAQCKLAAITITKGGSSLNPIYVMVIKYN